MLGFYCKEKKTNFINDVVPNMKNLIKDSIQSVFKDRSEEEIELDEDFWV